MLQSCFLGTNSKFVRSFFSSVSLLALSLDSPEHPTSRSLDQDDGDCISRLQTSQQHHRIPAARKCTARQCVHAQRTERIYLLRCGLLALWSHPRKSTSTTRSRSHGFRMV